MSDAAKTPTRLYLIRHAEVEEPYQKIFGGRLDIGLSPRGREQAAALAARLRELRFAGIYASPMKRVQQTLAPWLASNGHHPLTRDALREVDFGAWTGFTWDEVRTRFQKRASDWLHELESGGIPEAEPPGQFRQRVAGCVDEVLARHPGDAVAIACHGGVIRMALAHLLELPIPKMAHFEIDYASLTVVEHGRGRAEVQLLNYTPWRELP